MKKVLYIASMAALIISAAGVLAFADKRSETAQQAAENICVGWNLGNTLESNGDWIGLYTEGTPHSYETAWGNAVTTPELIAAVKAAGFNAVRVPVTWHEHIGENGCIDEQWLSRVQEVVDYVIEQDMYCVINIHHDSGGGWLKATTECYEENSERFAAIWTGIAEHFRDYDDRLIFEGFNEMLDGGGHWGEAGSAEEYRAHNDFNQLFVDTVRATGGRNADRNLMVQVYSGMCAEGAFDNFILPEDMAEDHLMIQVHNYDPQPFTWTSVYYALPRYDWGSEEDRAHIEQLFGRIADFSEEQGVPVIVGEFGGDFKEHEDARIAYVEHFIRCASENGVKCFWWDTGAMALFDRESCTEKYPYITDILDEHT